MSSDDEQGHEHQFAAIVILSAFHEHDKRGLSALDVQGRAQEVLLCLGDPPAPVPKPIADLLLAFRQQRSNLRAAANPTSRVLYPGRAAGQQLDHGTMRLRQARAGIPSVAVRTSSLRHMLTQAPPSVIAQMLGYATIHAEKVAALSGATWKSYAPGHYAANLG